MMKGAILPYWDARATPASQAMVVNGTYLVWSHGFIEGFLATH